MALQRKKTGFFSLLFLGLIFTATGGAIVHFFGHDIYLTASREAAQCEITRVGLLGQTEVVESFPLESLLGASVQESRDSDGDTTYKVIIDTDQGTIPLSGYSSSGRKQHQENANRINAFVNGQTPELSVKQSGMLIRVIGIVFAGVGILMLFSFVGVLIKLILALLLLTIRR